MKKNQDKQRHQPFHRRLHCAIHSQKYKNDKKAKRKKNLISQT